MSSPSEKRKLAAVMFADLEGYTSLFQKNEASAFKLVEQHRADLQEVATRHNGQVVKFYGDGSLTLFHSIIEAVQCAIELQQVSGKNKIPLRIGIHMGEMIEKHDDVYGDAVNVASRIQALGTSGSVLVSSTVIEALKNHPSIHAKSLGIVHLKNVKEAVEVFAILETGLTIPQELAEISKRKQHRFLYFAGALLFIAILVFIFRDVLRSKYDRLGEDCIIIPPFRSFDSNPRLNTIGELAASIMSKVMNESAKVEIIDYRSTLLYTNVDLASINDDPAIARRMGAKYMIQGDITLEGNKQDSLHFLMRIVDLYTRKNVPFSIPDVYCTSDNYMDCIKEACNIMAGFWKSKKDYLFHFATDSAYIAYNAAQKKWANDKYDAEVKAYLLKAIHYDPNFLDAWFLLLDFFHNKKQYQNGLDSIALMEKRFPDLDQRQQEYFNYYKYDFEGKNVLAFTSAIKELDENKRDLFVNTGAMVMALEYLNDPATVIKLFKQIDNDEMDPGTCPYCQTRLNIAMLAYVALADEEKAGKLATKLRPYADETIRFIDLIAYYIKIKDTTSVNDIITAAAKKAGPETDEEPFLYLMTARLAATNQDTSLKKLYALKTIQYQGTNSKSNIARAQMLVNDLEDAKKNFIELLATMNADPNLYTNLGVIYAREGDKQKAEEMVQKIAELKKPFDYGMTPYRQAKIKANLGETNTALKLLRTALEEGITFIPGYTFHQDAEISVLHSNPEYQALLIKNRQSQ